MKILSTVSNKEYQTETVNILKAGGLVVAPSDTVYGLLVDSTNDEAVRKLLAFKNRPIGKPISVFLSDFNAVSDYTLTQPNQEKILRQFLPGPFTVILPSKHKVSKLLESERGTLGVRVIDYKPIQDIVNKFGRPVTATSANISGKHPHHSLSAFLNTLSEPKKKLIDLVIDAGTLPRNKPSTVIDLSGSDIKILRKGDILIKNEASYISNSSDQTKKIGAYLFKKYQNSNSSKPLIFIIEGDLGVGKTILVKGIGDALNIKKIISPTFVIYYEYPISNGNYKNLVHADLYNISEVEEFDHLGLESYLNDKNIICFEWGERMGEFYKKIRPLANIVYIKMTHEDENTRHISIST